MKKWWILAVIGVCLMLQACTASPEVQNGTTAPGKATQTTEAQGEPGENNGFRTETQAAFAELIRNNPIDLAYNGETVEDQAASQKKEAKYIQIWREELAFSTESYGALLQKADKDRFMRMQSDWLKNLDEEIAFVSDTFANDSEDASVGTLFRLEQAIHYRECIRERVLYIKYLQYLTTMEEKVVFSYKAK